MFPPRLRAAPATARQLQSALDSEAHRCCQPRPQQQPSVGRNGGRRGCAGRAAFRKAPRSCLLALCFVIGMLGSSVRLCSCFLLGQGVSRRPQGAHRVAAAAAGIFTDRVSGGSSSSSRSRDGVACTRGVKRQRRLLATPAGDAPSDGRAPKPSLSSVAAAAAAALPPVEEDAPGSGKKGRAAAAKPSLDVPKPPAPKLTAKQKQAIRRGEKLGGKSAGGAAAVPADRRNLLIVGLGNPGDKYADTRHNIGFMVAEELARRNGANLKHKTAFHGEYASCRIGGKSVGILRPSTFMNLSGQSARQVMDFFKMVPGNVLVLVDESKLEFGQLRLRGKGSAGGHNGLKSMQSFVKTPEYPRLRIGIGEPRRDLSDHVLGVFNKQEKKELPFVIAEAVEAAEAWCAEDNLEKVMTRYNGSKGILL